MVAIESYARARADDLAIIRRLSLALTGTIPSLEEIRLLEAQPEPQRIVWWLDGLLADRRSSDYLAERFARAFVGVQDGPLIIYRRRRFVAWLADELSNNRPYDQIVRQMISASGLWTDHPATNFITVTIKPDQDTGPDAEDLAVRVSRTFLGIRMDCAQCHDHPFERWKQRDFQSLAAFFGQTEQTFRGIQDDALGKFAIENRKTGKLETVNPGVPLATDLLPATGTRRAAPGNLDHASAKSRIRAGDGQSRVGHDVWPASRRTDRQSLRPRHTARGA